LVAFEGLIEHPRLQFGVIRDRERRVGVGTAVGSVALGGCDSFRVLSEPLTSLFRINEQLGEGPGMRLHAAVHRGPCRISMIRKVQAAGRAEQRLQLTKEVSRLDLPNILRVLDAFEDTERYYVVRQHCAGILLQEARSHPAFQNESTLALLAFQVLSALSYVHNFNNAWAHRCCRAHRQQA